MDTNERKTNNNIPFLTSLVYRKKRKERIVFIFGIKESKILGIAVI